MTPVEQLVGYSKMTNLVEEAGLDKIILGKISSKVLADFKDDLNSQSEWLKDVEAVEELAVLTAKKKNTPLPNSANIKYPLITKACYEFSSRTYPEIVKDGTIAKARVLGKDHNGLKTLMAERVEDYLNYQLLYENCYWELELEKLLNQLPLIGFICKKTYYDPIRKRIKSELVPYKDLIISGEAKSLKEAARISHIQHPKLNNIIESARSGLYCDEVVDKLIEQHARDGKNPEIDIVEQETLLDLDDDNFYEPYFVTFIKETGDLLRIAPRFMQEDIHSNKADEITFIDPIEVYTDYHFLTNPKGKFQGVGFGILMLHLNETINSVLNQLIDAGQLANMQGGLIDSKVKGLEGEQRVNPGQWTKVKTSGGMALKDGFFPLQYKEPSNVLQQLLDLLVQSGKDLSSSSEVMTGNTPADYAKTGAVNALQQQGLKIFTSIYKGIYRSLGEELQKIYRLNRIYLDPEKYYAMEDANKQVFQTDFEEDNISIIPIADPNLSSENQKKAKIQELMAFLELPGFDRLKVSKKIAQLSTVDGVEALMVDPNKPQAPNPDVIKIQADIANMAEVNKLKGHELAIREKELQTQQMEALCKCIQLRSQAILNIAQAQAQQDNGKFKEYQLQLDILDKHMGYMMQDKQMNQDMQQHQNQMDMQKQELDQNQQSIDQEGQQNAGQSQSVASPPSDQGS